MKRFNLTEETEYLGRNGTFRCIAFELFEFDYNGKKIQIAPINSKNDRASCYIEIPKKDLSEFINKLKELL